MSCVVIVCFSPSLDVLEVVKLPIASDHWVCGMKWNSTQGTESAYLNKFVDKIIDSNFYIV